MFYFILPYVISVTSGSEYTTINIKQKLDDFINNGLKSITCVEQSAVAVAVVQNGKVALANTYGLRSQEDKLAADNHTLFGIGSTTKAFTAIIVDKVLASKGYNWTTPIKTFFPSISLPGETRTNEVTYKDLFSHVVCLQRDDFIWMADPVKFSMADLIGKLHYCKERCKFRTQFIYNNLMFAMGAYIAEQISGRTWEDLITEHILQPYNMTETKLSWSEAHKTGNVAQGYQYWDNKLYPIPIDADKIIDRVGAAGSIHSTPADMAKYMQFLLDKSDYYQDLFWTPLVEIEHLGVVEPISKPTFPADQYFGNYSIAWLLGNYNEQALLFHGGDTFASHTLITIDKETRTGIYVSCTGSAVKARRANQLITWYAQDLLLGNVPWLNDTTYCSFPEPWEKSSVSDFTDKDYINYEPANGNELEEIAGIFNHRAYGNITLVNQDEGLYFEYSRINCILRRHKTELLRFRCHANVPYLVQDATVMPSERTLIVLFSANKNILYTNIADSTMPDNREFVRSSDAVASCISRTVMMLFTLLFIS